uniref:Uncharacterized protein n=1 Tax=Bicosoecida sp. CB-2014 TaxID=1486930 RepID=A0A7S1C302_9STRA
MAADLADELSGGEYGGEDGEEEYDEVPEAGGGSTVPHYCMPNFASILPNYSNSDQDFIKLAFSAASWVSTREMPANLAAGLQGARAGTMEMSRSSAPMAKPPVPQFRKKEVFSEFEYVPSRYSLAAEQRAAERLEDEAKRLAIGGKDWAPSSKRARMKHEDLFEDKEYRFPYMSDPYTAARDQAMRARWIEDSKILHGPFLPGGPAKSSEGITRQLLPAILKELHRVVDEDWGDYIFSVMSTEDDMIVVRFQADTVDSERGLHAYMNVLASTGDVVSKNKLTRVVEDWHAQPGDGFLYYMFRPPWVRARGTDAFFTLHPEERAFSTSLAATLKSDGRGGAGGDSGESKK